MKQGNNYSMFYEYKPEDLGEFQIDLLVWNGQKSTEWYLDKQGNCIMSLSPLLTTPQGHMLEGMRTLCYLNADLSGMSAALQPQKGKGGRTFWEVDFTVVIYFGDTQLKAAIEWVEKVCIGFSVQLTYPYLLRVKFVKALWQFYQEQYTRRKMSIWRRIQVYGHR